MVYEEELKQETDAYVKETARTATSTLSPPFTSRSVDSQGAPSDFNTHYEGMYDDLQAAKSSLVDSGKDSSSNSKSPSNNNNNNNNNTDDDLLHNGNISDMPYGSIRYDKKVR